MKVSGTATLHAPVGKVWAALQDPAVLVRTIPGCERLEEIDRDAYRMTVTAGVASIKGRYAGEVRLTEQHEPHSFVLKATGAGGPGTVSAEVSVRLEPGDGDATTVLSYDADAVVGGMIGGVGQRMLTGVAKKTAGEFFAAVDQALNGGTAATPAERDGTAAAPAQADGTAGGRAGQGGGSSDGGRTPAVFTRPAAVGAAGLSSRDFVAGAVFGAAVGLLGALVGGLIARRRP